jgi:hypothetical protein
MKCLIEKIAKPLCKFLGKIPMIILLIPFYMMGWLFSLIVKAFSNGFSDARNMCSTKEPSENKPSKPSSPEGVVAVKSATKARKSSKRK